MNQAKFEQILEDTEGLSNEERAGLLLEALEETETKVQEVRDYNTGINWAIWIGAFILTITGINFIKEFLWHK